MAETPNLLDWILKKLRELKAPTHIEAREARPTITPTPSPSEAISRGLVSAGREPTRAQAPIAPEPTPAERLSAGIAKARYGK